MQSCCITSHGTLVPLGAEVHLCALEGKKVALHTCAPSLRAHGDCSRAVVVEVFFCCGCRLGEMGLEKIPGNLGFHSSLQYLMGLQESSLQGHEVIEEGRMSSKSQRAGLN